ncbi:MAG: hypothetical protein VZQ83_07040 [Eubacterium sp.]|nr:hypothetical protein [Eubacterium sp.]
MSATIIMELIYTVLAGIAFVIGARMYLRKRKPLYAQMIVCMLGCRFLQGLLETLLVRSEMDLNIITLSGLGQLAQYLFLICANYGAIDSLCDDGSRTYLKYRIIAGIIPLGVVATLFVTRREITDTPYEMGMTLAAIIIPLIAFYYHFKHLIIKDVEGGLIQKLRLYNLLGVLNCVAYFLEWFTSTGTAMWYIALILYDIVTVGILPALRYGLKIDRIQISKKRKTDADRCE